MDRMWLDSYKIAIPLSTDGDGIAKAIYAETEKLGHRPVFFDLDSRAPFDSDVVFLFGPFGKFLHIPDQFSHNARRRPVFVFWNTEGLPDLRLPLSITKPVSIARSWLGRFSLSRNAQLRKLAGVPPLSTMESRLLRFRYLGDYLYAHRQGWVNVFADISAIYAGYLRSCGIPAKVAPFGSFSAWYDDLGLERDIDVLWMGKRATKRRSLALDQITAELRSQGVNIHIVDNIENPFVHDDERTHLVNRSKICINLLRTWYDENSLRFTLVAPNRCLIVSEPILPHVPQYKAGVHYVSTPIERMAEKILHYLEHEDERQRIVENAYQLTTTVLTFENSMRKIMDACDRVLRTPRVPLAQGLQQLSIVE